MLSVTGIVCMVSMCLYCDAPQPAKGNELPQPMNWIKAMNEAVPNVFKLRTAEKVCNLCKKHSIVTVEYV